MTNGMFCPECKSLLTPRGRGSAQTKFCKSCGYSSGGAFKIAVPRTSAPRHGDFPLFPYEKIRDSQREFMEDMRAGVAAGKVMVVQAPTGIGKTVATLSVLLEESMAHKKKLIFLTSKQSQHRMVVDTLREISTTSGKKFRAVDIIAKQAMCPEGEASLPPYAFQAFCFMRVKTKSCPLHEADGEAINREILNRIMHVGEMRRACERHGVCPYKAALDAIEGVDVVVCDYNYVFDVMWDKLDERLENGLNDLIIVVDEAHNLPDRIRSNLSKELTAYGMDEAAREVGSGIQRGQRYTGHLKRTLAKWTDALREEDEIYVPKERLASAVEAALAESLGDRDTADDYIAWLEEVGQKAMQAGAEYSHALELSEFLRGWMASGEGCARIYQRADGGSWRLKLYHMDPATMGGPIFSEIHAAVLMSGTLVPTEMYADVLGVPKERRMLRVYPSPFPPENRKVLALKGVSSEYTRRGEEMFTNYARTIAEIARATPGNVAAFFPSYKYLEEVSERLGKRTDGINVLVEGKGMSKGDREDILRSLTGSRCRSLLMAVQGGSLGEGIDYAENLLSTLVVAGLPLAPPNKEVLALRSHYVRRFGREKGETYGYFGPAFNKVVQSAGRLIRSETDRGVVVLLDERFMQPKYAQFLPPELAPEVCEMPAELVGELDSFFSR
jgi:DNA excision repair protein ERCC-2